MNGENGSAPTLSLNFSRLLDQPYSQLSHFRYGFFTHPSNRELGLHVVIDERPSTFAQTWTRLADEVYIQRNDWFEWNLPLFIRNGDTLRPRLEDEHMVRMVRTVIWEDNEHPVDQPVLLKTLPRVRDRARRSGEDADSIEDTRPEWEALFLKGMKPLTHPDVFRFFHKRFPGAYLEYRTKIPEDLETLLHEKSMELTEVAQKQLHPEIDAAVIEMIEKAETHWTETKAVLDKAESRLTFHDSAVTEIDTTIREVCTAWDAYVARVLEANNTLLGEKIAAAAEYREAQSARTKAMEEYELSQLDTQKDLENDRNAAARHRSRLNQLEGETETLEKELKNELESVLKEQKRILDLTERFRVQIDAGLAKARAKLEAEREKLSRLQADVKQLSDRKLQLDETEENIRRTKKKISDLQQEIDRQEAEIATAEADIESRNLEIKAAWGEIAVKEKEIEESKKKNKEQEAALEARQKEIAAEMEDLARKTADNDIEMEKLEQSARTIQESRSKWEALITNLNTLTKEVERLDGISLENTHDPREIELEDMPPQALLDQLRRAIQRTGSRI